MAENSKIEWCDHTINLWWGCTKVHTGCKNCYAETLSKRFDNDIWGNDKNRKRIKSAFIDLDRYQNIAEKKGVKFKIFIGSMMDIFEDNFPLNNPTEQFESTQDLRKELFKRITQYKYDNLIFLFLTKRPRNIWKMIPEDWSHGWFNVWFGTSISDEETSKYSDQLQNSLKYQNLFLSIEPQVGIIQNVNLSGIDWVIQGGESGAKKRPFNIEWAYKMKEICEYYEVPYLFKQIDKIQSIPEDLNIRQFPKFI